MSPAKNMCEKCRTSSIITPLDILFIKHNQSMKISQKRRPGSSFEEPGHKPGNDLLSRDLTSYYHWLLRGLTAVFGMGTGGTPGIWSPGNLILLAEKLRKSSDKQHLRKEVK